MRFVLRRLRFLIARNARDPHKARMFVLGGDAFPHDTQSLRTALAHGAKLHGADDGAVSADGNFPSLETLRMNLTGVRLDSHAARTAAPGISCGGFFARSLDIAAQPARIADVPVSIALLGTDCVFAFGTAADGVRVASLESCAGGTLDASAATADIEAALLRLARDAASKHGAEVESVRLTLVTEGERAIALSAVAVAKAMFFTATLTIRARAALGDDLDLRLSGTSCTGDGMLANLAAAQLRPRLAALEARAFSIRSFLPAGLHAKAITLGGGDALRVHSAFGGGA